MVAGKIGREEAPGELVRRSLRSPDSLDSRSSSRFARRIFFALSGSLFAAIPL